jgi:ABC-type taurine transport system ATPase subunit
LDDLIAAPWWVVVQKRQRDRNATILNLDCVGLQATEGEAICELSTGARTFLSVVQRVGKRVPLFFFQSLKAEIRTGANRMLPPL